MKTINWFMLSFLLWSCINSVQAADDIDASYTYSKNLFDNELSTKVISKYLAQQRLLKKISKKLALRSDIVKNSIVLFLAEMLGSSIHEEEQNQSLFNYLEYALLWLDKHPANSNFHLLFLLNLTKYLGFYPDTSFKNSPFFDLQEGSFCQDPSLNPLIQNELLENFKSFLGMDFEALQAIQLTKSNRRELLKMVILYFRLHVHGFREPKSLAVLNAVFQ